jgi:hypothetical protein
MTVAETGDEDKDIGGPIMPARSENGPLATVQAEALSPSDTSRAKQPLSAAQRMRDLRTRRRNGLHCVRILLHETEIDSLIEKGFLKKERRNVHKAVESALLGFVMDTLGSSDAAES